MIAVRRGQAVDLHEQRAAEIGVVRNGERADGRARVNYRAGQGDEVAVDSAVALQRLATLQIEVAIRAGRHVEHGATVDGDGRGVAEGTICAERNRAATDSQRPGHGAVARESECSGADFGNTER